MLAGSFVLFIAYFIVAALSEPKNEFQRFIKRDLLVVLSLILFLLALLAGLFSKSNLGYQYYDDMLITTQSTSTLLIFILMEEILITTMFAKMLLVIFYYVYFCISSKVQDPNSGYLAYLNTLTPLFSILVLLGLRITHTYQKRERLENNKNCSPDFYGLLNESIFYFDRKGRARQLNSFCIKNLDFSQDHSSTIGTIFTKITDAVLIEEETFAKPNHNRSLSSQNSFQNSERDLLDKRKSKPATGEADINEVNLDMSFCEQTAKKGPSSGEANKQEEINQNKPTASTSTT